MTSSKLISYTTREFLTENELELYVKMQDEIYTPAVIDEFIKSGLLRRALTKVWNKKGASKLAIIFEYKDDQSFVACQKLLEKYHHPKVKNFANKVVGTRGIVLHEFAADEFS
jgi:hypothetical protein|tara:strand:- start:422 stop:760 length:339 start_codon:yes stop_codon:yes gene_type:complete